MTFELLTLIELGSRKLYKNEVCFTLKKTEKRRQKREEKKKDCVCLLSFKSGDNLIECRINCIQVLSDFWQVLVVKKKKYLNAEFIARACIVLVFFILIKIFD